MSFSNKNDKSEEELLLIKLEELENRFDEDSTKKSIIKKIKNNLQNLEFSGPETDINKIKKDLILAILELISWMG